MKYLSNTLISRILSTFGILFLVAIKTHAQDGTLVDPTNSQVRNSSAALEVYSTNQGFLTPRVSLTQTTSSSPVTSPATGLMVYNTNAANDVTAGYYYWDGGAWKRLLSGASNLSGSGTPNYHARWITANTLGIGVIYDDGTNVGIATTTTNNRLQIASDNSSQALQFNTSSYIAANQWGTRIYKSDIGGGIPLKFQTQSGATWYDGIDLDHGQDNGHPSLKTYYNTQLATVGGNVGIATTVPGWKLDVNGNARIGANAGQNALAALTVSAGQGSATTYRDIDIHGSWAGGEGHAITASHDVGATNIVGQIVFQHDGPGSRIKFGRLYHGSDRSTYPMELISNGNTATLELTGQIKIGGGSPGAGKVLVSDATGLASWLDQSSLTVNYANLAGIPTRTAWSGVHRNFVAEQLSWKNYGNNHTVFDASQSTSPQGTAVSNTDAQIPWSATYPTLMGWNGTNTYGVRVDMARNADNSNTVGGLVAGSFMQYQGFTLDATNTMIPNRSGFTYSVNAPHTGPIVYFDASGYGMQINSRYHSGGNLISYRTRNGDIATWNPWIDFVTSANYTSYGDNLGNHTATTTLNMNTQNISNVNDIYATQNYGRGLVGVYSDTRYQNVWAMGTSWRLAADGTTPGNLYGVAWTHSNIGGQSKAGLSHQMLIMENGLTKVALGSGIWTSYTSYIPYIYDTDNTAFFVDPNSQTLLNKLRVDGNGSTNGHWGHDPYGYGWGSPYASFRNLEVSSSGNFSTEPAMLRIHQWGSGAAEFWKPQGATLYLRETPGGGGGWYNMFEVQSNQRVTGNLYAPIMYDNNDNGYYIDPNSTSQFYAVTNYTRAAFNMARLYTNRRNITSDQNYWTGSNGWGTGEGTFDDAWKWGYSGMDIWGSNTGHPQGSGYIHAQGIISGLHYATTDGSSAYGWMMVGATNATENRYWLRGKWGGGTSGWVEMITTGNLASHSGTGGWIPNNGNGDWQIASSSTATHYGAATLELRESNFSGGGGTPPHLGFHWGGVVASNIAIEADGTIAITNNPGTGYEKFRCLTLKSNGFIEPSDGRLKNNIYPIGSALEKVKAMQGVTYNWNKAIPVNEGLEDRLQYGLIAQEVEKIIPELVHTDKEGWKSIEYSHLVPVLIEAIKEQQVTIEAQQKMMISNTDDITYLKEYTKQLEAKIMNIAADKQSTGNK